MIDIETASEGASSSVLLGDELDFSLGVPGFTYGDLYRPDRLAKLAEAFYTALAEQDAELAAEFSAYRLAQGEGFAPRTVSDLLVRTAPHLGRFVAKLFDLESEAEQLAYSATREDDVFVLKRDFVQRRVLKRPAQTYTAEEFACLHDAALAVQAAAVEVTGDSELDTARTVAAFIRWDKALEKHLSKKAELEESVSKGIQGCFQAMGQASEAARLWLPDLEPGQGIETAAGQQVFVKRLLERLESWLHAAAGTPAGRVYVRDWVAFRQPEPMEYENLVQLRRPRPDFPELMVGPESHLRFRDGFHLTDPRYNRRENHAETDYCIFCHPREKDSCSKGFVEKDGSYRKNPLGIPLEGCPLDEKISEAQLLHRRGEMLGALAVIVVDNPMVPGTGHRICNDCMKACIFQKQSPVNIPQAETGILSEVLNLPFGFEIYGLLTRWNPLNVRRPFALPYNGKNVLVVGMGPAGYTLAHFLLNEGFGVVGVDGLKIEPLSVELTGDETRLPRAIRQFSDISSDLETRNLSGFGGVSEYGITVRWDKNFLTVIQLTLARRQQLKVFGGIRFGGTFGVEDAWNLGFDHIALATGAGKPTIVPIKNNLIRGIRMASDFLMALQLTGAFKRQALANLQVRLPAVVIGGGLTAIDAATELAAYYPLQVEKTLNRFEKLVECNGEAATWAMFDREEQGILREFLDHGRLVRAERERAREAGRAPDFVSLVRSWGGVTIAYRKRLIDSPAYRLNHEEIIKSLEEGIYYAENLAPTAAEPGEFGAVAAMSFERQSLTPEGKWVGTGESIRLEAKTVLVAAGTSPNIVYEKEHPGTFRLDKWKQFFAGYKAEQDETGRFHPIPTQSPAELAMFTSYEKEGRLISYYGDNHPKYAGNVVKAMASAKAGYSEVVKLFAAELAALDATKQAERDQTWLDLVKRLENQLIARVVRVERLTPTIVEVVIHAPFQARHFEPGQFYRLQNYESLAAEVEGTKLLMEGLALTGAWVDKDAGLLSLIVLEIGVSSRMCALLKPGEPVVVMGPTGAPTEIPENETVLLAGGGLGNAVLFSIAKALKQNNNRVLYFAGYKNGADLYKQDEIEVSTDQVVWATDAGTPVEPRRPQDVHFRGNIVQAMAAYAEGQLGEPLFRFCEIDRIIAIGSDRMMNAVRTARKDVLKQALKPDHTAIGSINSPMQCMMKEICAQCLQKHVDPETGKETAPVFSCFNQDQKLDEVDFANLNDRLRANSVQEKLTGLWFERLLRLKTEAEN
ncbi:MAG: FAD-dependent oxidoreductase [Blastocatellia bacterium]|nr:FAD-dependent oxidoreductase [Blastocatellia bacterium]